MAMNYLESVARSPENIVTKIIMEKNPVKVTGLQHPDRGNPGLDAESYIVESPCPLLENKTRVSGDELAVLLSRRIGKDIWVVKYQKDNKPYFGLYQIGGNQNE
ncbi:hypothetical protein GF323_00425 [Candidatus Woesearchaeota archaeon]|nr:hypothetical protein [Candidatus Woesearchaeota archaeon]